MKLKHPVILGLVLLFLLNDLSAQPIPCLDPPMMTSTCAEACIICDIDGFTGRHEATEVGQAPPGFAGECTFVAHNMQWIAFIAGSTNLEVRMSISNCQDGIGLEFGLYKGDNCQNFERISNCFGGAAGIVAPGGSGVIRNSEPLVIGQYYYIVMDGGLGDNCDWTFDVVNGDTRAFPLNSSGEMIGVETTCPFVAREFVVEPPVGATEFAWTVNGVSQNINNDTLSLTFNQDGLYQLCVTSSNACAAAPPTCRTVIVQSIPTTELVERICEDEVYEIEGLQLNETGVYEFPLITEEGCDSLVVLDLEVVPTPILNLELNICEMDTLFIGNTPFFETGAYQERFLTELGCDSIVNLDLLTVICQIQASQMVSDVDCNGLPTGAITFQIDRGTPPFTYQWEKIDEANFSGDGILTTTNSSEIISGLPNGTYLITISDDFGNQTILISEVNEPTPITASFTTLNQNGFDVSCFGAADGQLEVFPSGGVGNFQLLWADGQQSAKLNGLTAGLYSVNITDGNNCVATFAYEVTSPEVISFEVLAEDANCEGVNTGSLVVENIQGGAADYIFQLGGAPQTDSSSFENLSPGNYEIAVFDGNGCFATETFSLEAAEIPILSTLEDLLLNLGDSVQLQIATNDITISQITWDTINGLSCADCLTPIVKPFEDMTYTLSVTSADDCTTSASFSVSVNKRRQFYAPNAFSPNLDGANDFFTIYGSSEVEEIVGLQVFDRWGNLLYDQQNLTGFDHSRGWDGKRNGQQLGQGIYVWMAKIRFIDGYEEVFSGNVLLVR